MTRTMTINIVILIGIVIVIVICIVIVIFIVLVIVICLVIVLVPSDHPTAPRTSLSPGMFIAGATKAKPFIYTRVILE